jgi:hypothetical protein
MLNLKDKKFVVSMVNVYWQWEDQRVKLSYIQSIPDPERTRTDKEWNVRPQFNEVVKFYTIKVSDLGEKFKGKSKDEICQVLNWKTISNTITLDI